MTKTSLGLIIFSIAVSLLVGLRLVILIKEIFADKIITN